MDFLMDLEKILVENELIELYENGVQFQEMPNHLEEVFDYKFGVYCHNNKLTTTVHNKDEFELICLDLDNIHRPNLDIDTSRFTPVAFENPDDPQLIEAQKKLQQIREAQIEDAKKLYIGAL